MKCRILPMLGSWRLLIPATSPGSGRKWIGEAGKYSILNYRRRKNAFDIK